MNDLLPLAVSAIAVLLTFLYASWQDIKTRTVATATWYPAAVVGGVVVLYFWYLQFQHPTTTAISVLALSVVICILMWGCAKAGLFGLADTADPKHHPQRTRPVLAHVFRHAGGRRLAYPVLRFCCRRDHRRGSDLPQISSGCKFNSCPKGKLSQFETSVNIQKDLKKNWSSTGRQGESGSPTAFRS